MISLSRRLLLLIPLLIAIYGQDAVYADDVGEIVPIVSAEGQASISRNGLGAIFKMRLQQWRDGTAIKVFVLGDKDPIHSAFSKKILNVFPHQLRRSWNKLVFSGSGQAPTILKSKETMLTKIANTPGAIGYMSVKDLNDQVRELKIQ